MSNYNINHGIIKVPLNVAIDATAGALATLMGANDDYYNDLVESGLMTRKAVEGIKKSKNLFNPFLMGAPGVGKTQRLEHIAAELEASLGHTVGIVMFSIGTMGDDGLFRVARYDKELGTNIISYHPNLPTQEKIEKGLKCTPEQVHDITDTTTCEEYGILFLDEITSSRPEQVANILKLLDSDRSNGEYKVPDTWIVATAGNQPEQAHVMDADAILTSTFYSRVHPFEVYIAMEDDEQTGMVGFDTYMQEESFEPEIRAYLSTHPEYLETYKPAEETKTGMEGQISNPRNWAAASKNLADLKASLCQKAVAELMAEKNISRKEALAELNTSEIYKKLTTTIGWSVVASRVDDDIKENFKAFVAYENGLDSVKDVWEGKCEKGLDFRGTEDSVGYTNLQKDLLVNMLETKMEALELQGATCSNLLNTSVEKNAAYLTGFINTLNYVLKANDDVVLRFCVSLIRVPHRHYFSEILASDMLGEKCKRWNDFFTRNKETFVKYMKEIKNM